MLERDYQRRLIVEIQNRFPGCYVLKNDSEYIQGIPDLTILYRDKWAMLEVKAYANAPQRPNQDYYVRELNRMSFASFIYPENEEEVLSGLQFAFEASRPARVSKP